MTWETELLRDFADKLQDKTPELASKLRVIAINFEDQKLTIANQAALIWELRREVREKE